MLRRVLVLIALAAAGACSAEGEPPEDFDAAVVRDGLGALFAGDHPEVRDTEAGRCFAQELTDATTPQELHEAGVLDERFDVVAELPPLPRELAETWATAQFACTDFVEESTRAQLKVTKGRLSPDDYAACLRAEMSEDDLREAVVESLAGDWEGEQLTRLGAAQSACVERSRGSSTGS